MAEPFRFDPLTLMRSSAERLATVQIDLDGAWVLLRCLGERAEPEADGILESGIPRMLDLLGRHRIQGTFFVNANDLLFPRTRRLIERLAAEGHEVANHGLDHSYFSTLNPNGQLHQIVESSRIFRDVLGAAPSGFRAPGYDFSGTGLALLEEHGYRYDSSAFPTSIAPLLLFAQRWMARGVRVSYPWLAQLRAPLSPYRPHRDCLYRAGGKGILELPVTVVPWLKWPLHFSYGALIGSGYLRCGVRMALACERFVNFVFHAADLADPPQDARLRCVPGLGRPLAQRLAMAERLISDLTQQAEVLPSAALCERLAREGRVEGWEAVAAASGRVCS